MSDYNIISTDYSLKTEIEDSGVIDCSNKIGVTHKEVIYLKGHTLFTYYLGDKLFEGECIYPVAKVCTVTYSLVDGQIKATNFKKDDPQLTQDQVDKIIEDAVKVEYESSVINQMSTTISQLCVALCNKIVNPSEGYPELESWVTGIGRGYGEINSKYVEWEYPVQIGSMLRITQAYLARLLEDELTIE